MPRAFDITPSTPSAQVDSSGRGELAFAVSNALKRALRVRLAAVPKGSARPEWLSIEGGAERELAADQTLQVTVKLAIPAGTPAGTHRLTLLVSGVNNPDEDYAESQEVPFSLAASAPPPRPFPWWIVAIAAGALAIAGGGYALFKLLSRSQDAIALPQLCENLSRGAHNAVRRANAARCGEPLSDEDIARLPLTSGPNALPGKGLGSVFTNAFSCDASDGGLKLQVDRLRLSVTRGRMAYDEKKAFACRALGRDGGVDPMELTGLVEPCASVLTGLQQIGDPCDAHEECAGESYCKPDGVAGCSGKCAPRLGNNVPCNPNSDVCVSTAVCKQVGGAALCVPLGGSGAKCTYPWDCAQGLRCAEGECRLPSDENGTCTDTKRNLDCKKGLACADVGGVNRCVKPAKAGQPCGPAASGAPCESDCMACDALTRTCVARASGALHCTPDGKECLPTFYCGSAGTCVLKPREGERCAIGPNSPDGARGNCLFADTFCRRDSAGAPGGVCARMPAQGEKCGRGRFDLTPACKDPLYCKGEPEGVCAPPPAVGEACSGQPGQTTHCADGAYCDLGSQRCVAFPSAGNACGGQGQCEPSSAFCDFGTRQCVAKRAPKEPCTQNDQCAAGVCDPAAKICVATCTLQSTGCGGSCGRNGARDLPMYLLFALVLVARRRKRGM